MPNFKSFLGKISLSKARRSTTRIAYNLGNSVELKLDIATQETSDENVKT